MEMGLTVSLMDEFTPLPDQRNIKIIVWQESNHQKLAFEKEKCFKISGCPKEGSFIIQIKKICWVKRNELLGSVHLGFASDNEDGREQWKEALQSPDTPCIKCYPLN